MLEACGWVAQDVDWMTSDHLGAIPVDGACWLPGYGFGLGFAVRTHAGLAPQPGSPASTSGAASAALVFRRSGRSYLFALLLTAGSEQRIYYRNLFRQLVYAALD